MSDTALPIHDQIVNKAELLNSRMQSEEAILSASRSLKGDQMIVTVHNM